jgi:ribosomal protein L13E
MHHIKPQVTKPDGKRPGKGFSPEELKKAGLNKTEAKQLKIPIDKRRKTTHEQNIQTIEAYAKKQKTKIKPKPKQKPQPKTKKKAKK